MRTNQQTNQHQKSFKRQLPKPFTNVVSVQEDEFKYATAECEKMTSNNTKFFFNKESQCVGYAIKLPKSTVYFLLERTPKRNATNKREELLLGKDRIGQRIREIVGKYGK